MTLPRRWLIAGAAAWFCAALAGIAGAQEPPEQPPGEIPELPSIEDLSNTVERPLFMRTRRPPMAPVAPVVEAAPVPVPSAEAPADLTGIVNGPDLTYAILTNRETKEVLQLRKGEKIEDWSLQEIGPRHVVLRRGPGSLRLELFEEKEPGEGAKRPPLDPEERMLRPGTNVTPRFVPRPQQVRRQQQQRRPRPIRQPNPRQEQ